MSIVLITLDIIDYLPQNFRFDNFSFIFSSDGHDLEDQINFMSKNQLTHKTVLNKRDIRYSIKVLRNDSLIGICDFIIPYVLLSKKEPFYEKICQVNMTDSTKRMLFGGLNSSNTLKINIRSTMQYIQEKVLVKQNTNFRKEKGNKTFSPKYQTKQIKKNQNNNIMMNNNNQLNNQNFVFNKQQIPMTVTTKKIAQKSNTKQNNINKFQSKPQKQNIADVMIQQQQNKKRTNNNNIYQKPEKKIIETNEEDPNDRSTLDEDIIQPIQLIDKEFTEFMPKFIEKNPLEQLGQFKDINEMLIYTKNVIDKLLCYQQEYYERLKNSVTLNHRLNDLLMKYNEKYRNIVKKVHRLNEETNSTDMRKDAVVSIHRAENTNLKQIIPLKMKELKLYQEMCGNGIQDIINNKENNNNTNEKGKTEQILMKLLKNCIKEYGPLDTLVKENSKINEEEKKSMKILNDQLCKDNNENNNIKLEFVVADNYNNLDEKIDNELKNIYEKNKGWPMVQVKKIDENVYEYEDKKLEFKEDGENLNIICEGEEMRFADFVEFMNEPGEEKNIEN